MKQSDDLATRRRQGLERPRASAYAVSVLEGPDAGASFRVDGERPRVLVGQSPACAFKLTDREVSRRHASIALGDVGLTLIDLGSTNGTFVNGARVKEVFLVGGEAVRLGSSVLSITREDDKAPVLGAATSFGRVVGESATMRRLFTVLGRLATEAGPVLLEGESGTGKELVAEELHALGPRSAQPFLVLDASADAQDGAALEAKLFGASGGPGLFDDARGGSIYIAEVGMLGRPALDRLAKRLDDAALRHEVRVIAGTRRDLDRDITQGGFHERLFYLLASGRVELPPLRDREGDAELIAEREWRALGGGASAETSPELPADWRVRFDGYPWPGNVDELKATVVARFTMGEHVQAYKRGERVDSSTDYLTNLLDQDLPFPRARSLITAEFERRYLQRVLDQNGGNVRKAAEASGVAHRYFQLVRARVR